MELYSLEQAASISLDFSHLNGQIFNNYRVKSVNIIQQPNNQPLYTVEVFLTHENNQYDFKFVTIHSFCYYNNIEFNIEKYK
jgi:hypothetical protein